MVEERRRKNYSSRLICQEATSTLARRGRIALASDGDRIATSLFGQLGTLKQFVHSGFFDPVGLTFATMREGNGFESAIFNPAAHGGVVNTQAARDFTY